MSIFYTDSGSFNILEVSGSTILSGSLIVSGATNFGPTGLTGSLFGSSSFATTASAARSITFTPSTASFATTSSAATSITFVPTTASFASTASFVNTLTRLTASNVQLNSLTDTTATNKVLVLNTTTNQIFTTASVGTGGGTTFPYDGQTTPAIISGSLIISSSATGLSLQITGSVNTSGSVTASAGFFGTSSWAQRAVSASYFSGSIDFPSGLTLTQLTASNAQLTNIVDTTATNKVLVLNTANNQIFTTASVGGGTGFPFNGNAVITGSLFISQSISGTPALRVTGSIDFVTGSTRINTAVTGINLTTGNGLGSDAYIQLDGFGPGIVMSAGDSSISISSTGVLPAYGVGNQLGEETEGDNLRWILYSRFINNSGNITTTAITASNALINGSVSASSYTSSLNNQVGFFGTSSFAQTASLSNNFSPNTVRLTVGTTAPTSPAINDLWVDTN